MIFAEALFIALASITYTFELLMRLSSGQEKFLYDSNHILNYIANAHTHTHITFANTNLERIL